MCALCRHGGRQPGGWQARRLAKGLPRGAGRCVQMEFRRVGRCQASLGAVHKCQRALPPPERAELAGSDEAREPPVYGYKSWNLWYAQPGWKNARGGRAWFNYFFIIAKNAKMAMAIRIATIGALVATASAVPFDGGESERRYPDVCDKRHIKGIYAAHHPHQIRGEVTVDPGCVGTLDLRTNMVDDRGMKELVIYLLENNMPVHTLILTRNDVM